MTYVVNVLFECFALQWCWWLATTSDEASRGARGAPAPPTATGLVEFLVLFF